MGDEQRVKAFPSLCLRILLDLATMFKSLGFSRSLDIGISFI